MPKAKDLMTTNTVWVDPDDPVDKAISLMLAHGLGSLPVIDFSGRLLGIISEFDLLELAWEQESRGNEVYRYMTREVKCVHEEDKLVNVVEQFRLHGVQQLPVVRESRLIGMVSRRDVLRNFRRPLVNLPLGLQAAQLETPGPLQAVVQN